jgi:hypothetical protein
MLKWVFRLDPSVYSHFASELLIELAQVLDLLLLKGKRLRHVVNCLLELLFVFLLVVELEFELLLELGHLTLMLSLLFESNSLELAFEFRFVLCDSFEFFFLRSDQ